MAKDGVAVNAKLVDLNIVPAKGVQTTARGTFELIVNGQSRNESVSTDSLKRSKPGDIIRVRYPPQNRANLVLETEFWLAAATLPVAFVFTIAMANWHLKRLFT